MIAFALLTGGIVLVVLGHLGGVVAAGLGALLLRRMLLHRRESDAHDEATRDPDGE